MSDPAAVLSAQSLWLTPSHRTSLPLPPPFSFSFSHRLFSLFLPSFSYLMSLLIFPFLYLFSLLLLSTVCSISCPFVPSLCSISLLTGLSSSPSSSATIFFSTIYMGKGITRRANLCFACCIPRETPVERVGHCFLTTLQSHR